MEYSVKEEIKEERKNHTTLIFIYLQDVTFMKLNVTFFVSMILENWKKRNTTTDYEEKENMKYEK